MKLDDGRFFSLFYNHKELYCDVGQEFCIALDVALSGSSCKAVAKGFYKKGKGPLKSGWANQCRVNGKDHC